MVIKTGSAKGHNREDTMTATIIPFPRRVTAPARKPSSYAGLSVGDIIPPDFPWAAGQYFTFNYADGTYRAAPAKRPYKSRGGRAAQAMTIIEAINAL